MDQNELGPEEARVGEDLLEIPNVGFDHAEEGAAAVRGMNLHGQFEPARLEHDVPREMILECEQVAECAIR